MSIIRLYIQCRVASELIFAFKQASIWEKKAALTDAQHDALLEIASWCAERPLPPHLVEETSSKIPGVLKSGAMERSEDIGSVHLSMERMSTLDSPLSPMNKESIDQTFVGTSLEDIVLENSSDFYSWLSELETVRNLETENKYQKHVSVLNKRLEFCDELLETVNGALSFLGELKAGHKTVVDRTSAIHETCQSLLAEKEQQTKILNSLKSNLLFFDEVDRIDQELRKTGKLWPKNVSVALNTMKRMDDCVAFMKEHPDFAESNVYSSKLKHTQAKIIAAIYVLVQSQYKAMVQNTVNRIDQIQERNEGSFEKGDKVMHKDSNTTNFPSSTEEVSKEETHIDINSTAMADITLLHIRFRASINPELRNLLSAIEIRAETSPDYLNLLRDCLRTHAESRTSVLKSRIEPHLKMNFEGLRQQSEMLRGKCDVLMNIGQMELQLLAQLYPNTAKLRDRSINATAPIINPLSARLYESLKYFLHSSKDIGVLCNISLTLHDIVSSIAEEQEPRVSGEGLTENAAALLLFPVLRRMIKDVQEQIMHMARVTIKEKILAYKPKHEDLAMAIPKDKKMSQNEDGTTTDSQENRILYPPVQCALEILQVTNGALSSENYDLLAQEIVFASLETMYVAVVEIEKDSQVSGLHGSLFRIVNLDSLRDGVLNYGADISSVHRDLDFSHVKDYLKRTLTGKLPLFSFSKRTAAHPEKHQTSAQQELDRQLKSSCEAVIMKVSKAVIDPALNFLTKVSALKASESQENHVPLREHAFAVPQRIIEVCKAITAALQGPTPEFLNTIKNIITKKSLLDSLMNPIQSNITEACGRLRVLLESEYTSEEVELACLLDDDAISSLFNNEDK